MTDAPLMLMKLSEILRLLRLAFGTFTKLLSIAFIKDIQAVCVMFGHPPTNLNLRPSSHYEYAKRSAFPSAVLILEEEEELFGRNPWGHGLTPENQVVLDKFVQYANEQGYIPKRPALSDLFAPVGN